MQPKIYTQTDGRALEHEFWCPACNMAHGFSTAPGRWTWNNDRHQPHVEPSILVRYGKRVGEAKVYTEMVCHLFIRNGRIEYCGDCTHEKAGQTIDLPGLDDDGFPAED